MRGSIQDAGHPPRKLSPEVQELVRWAGHIRSRPGITLAPQAASLGLGRAWCRTQHRVPMWNAAKRLGLSFKKSAASRRAGSAGRRRAAQVVERQRSRSSTLKPSSSSTRPASTRRWRGSTAGAPVGERCRDQRAVRPLEDDDVHCRTATATGMTAPWVLDGAMDGDAFRTYVRHVLAPTLRRGDVVVLPSLAGT